jgi:2-keto-4-pentenoate hydratase/2-oxohepta-3-ene-1,7-dioic acid hydratase in catechol pathway
LIEQRNRLVRVSVDGAPRWGVVTEKGSQEWVYRLEGSPFAAWEPGAGIGPLDELALLPPVTPSKIVCVGLNYADHAAESRLDVPEEPLLFFKPPSSVIGPGAVIRLPPQSARIDYEAELVIVIGRRCRSAPPEAAWDHVLGVTCGNDVTARDLQQRDHQWTRAKGFDTFCPLGPWIVMGVTEADAADLQVACRVNSILRQQGRTREMIFPPDRLIAYISAIMTLEPGDVIMTGTPAGIGPLAAGDLVEVDIEGIGTLRNPVEGIGSDLAKGQ